MAQYIEKAAIIAEIERRIKSLNKDRDFNYLQIKELEALLSFLDTHEVKEVDLEKEIETHLKECLDVKFPTKDIELIKKDVAYTARYFFEFGLKAQK